jgi:hypothetical protein
MQSMGLVGDSRRCFSSTRDLQLEPDWMNYLRCNVTKDNDSILLNPFPSFDAARVSGNDIGRYGYRSYGIYPAYPYGILRSELRSRAPVGQLPWYLPGSPGNLRLNDIRYRY